MHLRRVSSCFCFFVFKTRLLEEHKEKKKEIKSFVIHDTLSRNVSLEHNLAVVELLFYF